MNEYHMYTLPKFRRYNKASLGELVPLEILCKHHQGFTSGNLAAVHLLYLLDISCEMCKGFDHMLR